MADSHRLLIDFFTTPPAFIRYWTWTQQLAHQTINGCNMRPGDLIGTGTISGPDPTWNVQKPKCLNGIPLKFLEGGDEMIFNSYCKVLGNNLSNARTRKSFEK